MTQPVKNIVVVGGGLSGLFSALVISDQHRDCQVHVIEREKRFGGIYSSIYDSQLGWLDIGMHTISESGVEEIDRHIREAMDDQDWNILSGNHRDISGIFHGGVLHQDSPYIDIRDLPADIQRECLADFLLQLGEKSFSVEECVTTHDYFVKRFGQSIADWVIEPILKKLWNTNGSNLSAMASRSVLMDRIRLFDSDVMLDLMKSALLRSKVAFPKQMKLPSNYRSKSNSYYPKTFGMIHLIKAIEKKLLGRGVKLYNEAELDQIQIERNKIKSLGVKRSNELFEIGNIKMLHWSITVQSIAPKLGIEFPFEKLDPPNAQVLVYLFLKQKPNIGDIYYFYCLDSGYHTYRVTSFASYCPNAKRMDGAYPICVELHFKPLPNQSQSEYAALAIKELVEFGVFESADDVVSSKVEILKTGFPILTLNNSRMLADIRKQVESQGIKNLVVAGQAPERGIFFLHECLGDVYRSVNKFLEENNE
jgi:protoporphyrinogen oxidase